MLTSEFKNNLKKTGQVLFIVLITGLLLIWLNQGSLERFWQQKYHQDTPWSKMMGNPVWDYGSALHDGVQEAGLTFAYHASGQKAVDDKQALSLGSIWRVQKDRLPQNISLRLLREIKCYLQGTP